MKQKISLYQLFIIMVIFPYGSAILFFLVPETKQDAWIAMMFYSLGGIILQLLYTTLYYQYPKDTLVTFMPKIYGKIFGNILSATYISYFTYIGARVLRDFLELIKITGLAYTPMVFIGVIFIIIITYGVCKGIETIANTAKIFFCVMIFMPILVWILLILTGDVLNFYNLKPILQDGIIQVIKKGWPLITFPYGETILFTMIYPLVSKRNKIRKIAIAAVIFEGIILSLSTMLFIAALGVEEASKSVCPLFHIVERINIRDFLTRLDILFVVVLIMGGFFKVSLFMYAAVYGTLQITKFRSSKLLSYIFGIIILLLSQVMAESYMQHIDIGLHLVVKYIHIPLQIIIPILTLCVYYLKQLMYSKIK